MKLNVVILAAGKGTRMRSALPKVLHSVAGRSLLGHVLDTAKSLAPAKIVTVYGHGGDIVPKTLAHEPVTWVVQAEQLGTGHAVAQAMPSVEDDTHVLVLYGDVPLTTQATLATLLSRAAANPQTLTLLTAFLEEPKGYGRIVRDGNHKVIRIVEEKDATEAERGIKEINTGILLAKATHLRAWLARLENKNAQGEYYLTDVIAMAVQDGVVVETTHPAELGEILGVNDKLQLADIERRFQARVAQQLMRDGVTLRDPARLDVRGKLTVGRDVMIDVNVIFEGTVELADGVQIGANSIIKDASLGAGVIVKSHCVIDGAKIGASAVIGPFARVRPETVLAEEVHIGNFVEVKKATVNAGAKINHLSYVGDAIVGKRVNIGAGTITCNYDGANKHLTVIGDDAFIGSDTQLVAPVEIGAGATIGAGSTITRNAPADQLTLSRVPQASKPSWKRPAKKPKA